MSGGFREAVAGVAVGAFGALNVAATDLAVQQSTDHVASTTISQTLETAGHFRDAAEEGAGALARRDEVAEQIEGLDEPDYADQRPAEASGLLAAADADDLEAAEASVGMLDAADADAVTDAAGADAIGEAGGL